MNMRQVKKILKANGMYIGKREGFWHIGDADQAILTWATKAQVKRYVKAGFKIDPWWKRPGLTWYNSLPDVEDERLFARFL